MAKRSKAETERFYRKYPVEPGWILMRMLRDARRVGESAQGT